MIEKKSENGAEVERVNQDSAPTKPTWETPSRDLISADVRDRVLARIGLDLYSDELRAAARATAAEWLKNATFT